MDIACNSSLNADLLAKMLAGDPKAWEQYYRTENRIHERLVRVARRLIPHLAADLAEDVVSQMWTNLLWREVEFIPKRDGIWAFLRTCLRDSARDVSAQYASPGQKTRPYKKLDGEIVYPTQPHSLDEEIELPSGKGRRGDFIPSGEKDLALDQSYLQEILYRARSNAPIYIRAMLDLMVERSQTRNEAGDMIGRSLSPPVCRTTMTRRFDRWLASQGFSYADSFG